MVALTVLCAAIIAAMVPASRKAQEASLGAELAVFGSRVPMNPAMAARAMRAAHPGPLVNALHKYPRWSK